MQEIWKDIKGFEGYYQVSNLGRVKSLERYQQDKNGKNQHYKGKILKPAQNSKGYLRVELKNPNYSKRYFVHRLVAIHFVENVNPEIYLIINHIDNNPLNNCATNLEWTDYKGNTQHAIKNGRMTRTKEWLNHLRETNELHGTPVIGVNIITQEKIYFTCLNDCKNKGFQPSCVCNCCKGIRKTHKGYIWEYAKAR